MFDLPSHSDYDRWPNAFTEAPPRLDGLQNAVTDLRHLLRGDLGGLLRGSEGVAGAQILDVLGRHGV